MLRHTSTSTPASNSSPSPVTRAQLQAAIEAEERRQGLAPDNLVAESTLEEAAHHLGISPEKLREAAQQAPTTAQVSSPREQLPSLWTLRSRKLFKVGLAAALVLTGIEVFSRFSVFQQLQQVGRAIQASQPQQFRQPTVSPIDDHFKSLLARTVGPKADLRMVAMENSGWFSQNQKREEHFPLAGVPDGYEVYLQGSDGYQLTPSNSSRGVVFRPADTIPDTVAPAERDRTEGALRYVRYGSQWYARAWIANSDLNHLSQRPVNSVRLSNSPSSYATEVVLPAAYTSTYSTFTGGNNPELLRYYNANLPAGFKPDAALAAATKIHGGFRTPVPISGPNQSYSFETSYFQAAGFSVSSNLVDVSEMIEGVPFSVSDNMLQLLARPMNYLPTDTQKKPVLKIDFRPEVKGIWNVVRYGEDLYVRGWIAGPVRKDALNGKNLLVSSSPQNPQMGYQPVPITVPLTGFQSAGPTGNGWSTATFTQITLNKHAWEKW